MSELTAAETPPLHGKIVSHIPGRMRVRLFRDCREPDRIQQLKAELLASEGVTQVETNPVSGSVLILYDPCKHSKETAPDVLRQARVVIADAGVKEASQSEYSELAAALIHIVDRVDDWIEKITGRKISLRVLVPVGLGATGVAVAVVNGGLGFAELPAYVILWIAIDAFIQLHPLAV